MPSEKRFGRIAATPQTESRQVSHEKKTLYHLLIVAVFGSGCHRCFSTFAFPAIGTTFKIARRLGSDDSLHTPTVSSLPFLTRRTTTRLPPDHMSLLAPSASIRIEEGVADNDDEKKKIEGVIFDIDGTLADSWKLGYDATLLILAQNSIPSITQETYHHCTRYSTPDRLARHAGLHPDDHDRFVRVGETLARQFDDLYVRLVTVDTAGFYPGISDLIQNQIPRSIPMGALTNACVDYARAVLRVNDNRPPRQLDDDANNNTITTDRMSLVDRFVTVHGADSVPRPKPSPDGLLQCCHEMNLRPDQCVYIGDSPSDAAAAKAAGMKMAIGVSWGSHSEESLTSCGEFDILCSTVDELSQFLSRELK